MADKINAYVSTGYDKKIGDWYWMLLADNNGAIRQGGFSSREGALAAAKKNEASLLPNVVVHYN